MIIITNAFQSLIVAYRCKLELWDDDKVLRVDNDDDDDVVVDDDDDDYDDDDDDDDDDFEGGGAGVKAIRRNLSRPGDRLFWARVALADRPTQLICISDIYLLSFSFQNLSHM